MKTRQNYVETSSYELFLQETEKDAVSAHFVDITVLVNIWFHESNTRKKHPANYKQI